MACRAREGDDTKGTNTVTKTRGQYNPNDVVESNPRRSLRFEPMDDVNEPEKAVPITSPPPRKKVRNTGLKTSPSGHRQEHFPLATEMRPKKVTKYWDQIRAVKDYKMGPARRSLTRRLRAWKCNQKVGRKMRPQRAHLKSKYNTRVRHTRLPTRLLHDVLTA